MKVNKIENGTGISKNKVDKLYSDIVKLFQKQKPTLKEIIVVYSNLGYTLGASIGGYKDKGPKFEELELLYATKPTIDVALMMQALTMSTWIDDLDKTIEDIKQEKAKND